MSLIDGIYWQNVYDADKPKEKIPETNYDRFIRKTPEELAEFLAEYRCVHKAQHCMETNCAQCWLEWLKGEAEPC